MTEPVTIRTTIDRARQLSRMIDGAADGSSVGDLSRPPIGGTNPVIVANPIEMPSKDPDGVVNQRTLRKLSGSTWSDTGQKINVRRISNGRQIAWPVGANGFCVQDSTFWAVNIGSLAAATHPLTGHASGVAGVLKVLATGNLEITNDRLPFVRRDASGVIADGTLIQLAYVSGTLTIVWADCAAHTDLDGLVAAP